MTSADDGIASELAIRQLPLPGIPTASTPSVGTYGTCHGLVSLERIPGSTWLLNAKTSSLVERHVKIMQVMSDAKNSSIQHDRQLASVSQDAPDI